MKSEFTVRYGGKHLQDETWVRTGWVEWKQFRLEFTITEAAYQSPEARELYQSRAVEHAELAFRKLQG